MLSSLRESLRGLLGLGGMRPTHTSMTVERNALILAAERNDLRGVRALLSGGENVTEVY